jgi:hypothetical protein
MATGGEPVSGSGSLVLIQFQVCGAPTMTSTLHVATAQLNDGAIPVAKVDGLFTVHPVYSLLGQIGYWSASRSVAGARLSAAGMRSYTATTQIAGDFAVAGLRGGDYTLTATKSDDVRGISAFDASLVLRHAAQISPLTGYAAVAADVTRAGGISSMDAYYILRYCVGLQTVPFPGAGAVWLFDPASRAYTDLGADQSAQDFVAVLLGDPSGNWAPSVGGAQVQPGADSTVVVRVEGGTVRTDGRASASVVVDTAGDLYALELLITYDPSVASARAVTPQGLGSDWMTATNTSKPGEIRIALAGVHALSSGTSLLTLEFEMGPAWGDVNLHLAEAQANEGALRTQTIDGRLARWRAELPFIARARR